EIMPELASMFRSPIPEQSKKLIAMIGYVIHKLDKLDTILDEVGRLAERHVQYGVKNEHYAVVGGALLWTLEKGLGSEWNEQLKECWGICYQLLSDAMIQAGERSSRAA
ncbi:MAG TPA: globin domain-containing protein, partial [Chitinophagaceae bacterium]|nr:globin domain-containing protein [Chitinophagaceae bacterium]